jgi:ArsR family transcriptional regulator, arsenate/arsenite/antimonite-responsive transcriptional repressor
MEIRDAVMTLAALAQETRLAIFRMLIEAGRDGESVGRIGETLEIPGATLSFHLKELARSGLVNARQERQFIYYSVDFERVADLMAFLTQNCCQGMPRKCLTIVESALGGCCAPSNKTKSKLKRRKP